ncbi:MGMT family protein [Vibrio comitans]|uniref:Mgmt family protein n=1 Tax=Vibrio comitans NBRC 102076 TaxID=1219078 RepID=A0A4Y3II20_9VIBR|nr:MGMT family protein [Vibrio comitans]GEA59169.1 mgmt family protein [Vibrio comitans NBRC 102076]
MHQLKYKVFALVHQIPLGMVSTYGDIAKFSGYPGYARQVGAILSNLPEGSALPWHRVINSKGEISLKGEDLQRQKSRLVEEGIVFSAAGKVKLRQFRWQP